MKMMSKLVVDTGIKKMMICMVPVDMDINTKKYIKICVNLICM